MNTSKLMYSFVSLCVFIITQNIYTSQNENNNNDKISIRNILKPSIEAQPQNNQNFDLQMSLPPIPNNNQQILELMHTLNATTDTLNAFVIDRRAGQEKKRKTYYSQSFIGYNNESSSSGSDQY